MNPNSDLAFLLVLTASGLFLLTACGDDSRTNPAEEGTAECSDGIDNDGDGIIDCDELTCRIQPYCVLGDGGTDSSVLPPADSGTLILDSGQRDTGSSPTCGPTNCGGCCSDGACLSGHLMGACGAGGATCSTCGAGNVCSDRRCGPRPGACSATLSGSTLTDTCSGGDICICPSGAYTCSGTGTCEDAFAFGRMYRVSIGNVTVPDRRPDGMCWDPLCGAPDPFVEVIIAGTSQGSTPFRMDVFDALWVPPADLDVAFLTSGVSLVLSVQDFDTVDHDAAFVCEWDPINAATLRTRSLSCAGALGTVVATIHPL